MIQIFLNPEGHQNRISGSKVTGMLLKEWILPIGGVASGRVCVSDLRGTMAKPGFNLCGVTPKFFLWILPFLSKITLFCINCLNLLQEVGYKACPSDAVNIIQSIKDIKIMKKKGGDGSHNGLTSIIEHLETNEFPR